MVLSGFEIVLVVDTKEVITFKHFVGVRSSITSYRTKASQIQLCGAFVLLIVSAKGDDFDGVVSDPVNDAML